MHSIPGENLTQTEHVRYQVHHPHIHWNKLGEIQLDCTRNKWSDLLALKLGPALARASALALVLEPALASVEDLVVPVVQASLEGQVDLGRHPFHPCRVGLVDPAKPLQDLVVPVVQAPLEVQVDLVCHPFHLRQVGLVDLAEPVQVLVVIVVLVLGVPFCSSPLKIPSVGVKLRTG